MTTQIRVGIGFDIHRLVSDRSLVLGGVPIAFDHGLLGHSDGDVVLHAVADALLGATGLGDIGELFPDTDDRYKDADSRDLLKDIIGRVRAAGFAPGNVDLIIHAEKPNLSEQKTPIAQSIAALLGMPTVDVNVKAKTNEGLGPVGNEHGIACTAVVMVSKG